MRRRHFNAGLALALGIGTQGVPSEEILGVRRDVWASIEHQSRGRLGVAVLDTRTGRAEGHRLDERFPMCSTFKWLLAAAVLQRVADGNDRLDRRIAFGPAALLENSPTTQEHVGRDGLSIAQLCEAAVTLSDNTAANLLLRNIGGPAAVTREARRLGDPLTRLDRSEPALNTVRAGDVRDTTTPRAMGVALSHAALGNGLPPDARALLVTWMLATRTGLARLRGGIPADWRAADKTGSGRGTSNDVAVLWPPQRAPIVVTAFLTDSTAPGEQRDAALAAVARAVVARMAAAAP